jgi:hypothetical protein
MQAALNYTATRSFFSVNHGSVIMAIDGNGKAVDPKIKIKDKTIPTFTSKPFKFSEKWIKPTLNYRDHMKSVVNKLEKLR